MRCIKNIGQDISSPNALIYPFFDQAHQDSICILLGVPNPQQDLFDA